MKYLLPLLLPVFCLVVCGCRLAESTATPGGITIEWIYAEEGKVAAAIPSFSWLSDGTALLHDRRRPGDQQTLERYDPVARKRVDLVDAAKVLRQLESLLGKEQAPARLGWPAVIDRGGRWGIYLFGGDLFALNLSSSVMSRITRTEASEKSPRLSPDGSKLAFVREGDLYVWDLDKGVERRLTSDGSETLLNGTLSWVYWEEVFARRDLGYWWSEDSTAVAYLRTDESAVTEMIYQGFEPNIPDLTRQRYPKTGGVNPTVRLGVLELASGKTTWVDLSKHEHEYIVRVKWLNDSRRLAVQTMDRPQTRLDLFFVDREGGQPTHILTERDKGWVNIHDDLYFLKKSGRFLWASERSGYMHLYLYDLNGKLLGPVTSGDWAIRSAAGAVSWLRQAVHSIDEEGGWVYFTSIRKSSIEKHLYRVRFDGSGLERLTQRAGTHGIGFSENGQFYFNQHSSGSTPPSLALHARDGSRLEVVAPARPEIFSNLGMRPPEHFSIKTGDGFRMPAQLLRPDGFSPGRKYPVIMHVYGGPAAPMVKDAWPSRTYFDQVLLNHGYVVFRCDNRSATARSKALENGILHDAWGSGELADLLEAIGWLKSQPWVDPDRVGIWGWSGGGSFTLRAMTGSGEFRAGISVAPVTDWDYYDTIWTEAFMKRPQDNPEGYERTSLVRKASELRGRLLIVHGTHDDNVHPQNTLHFVNELIRAGIQFEMMLYPGRKHGIRDDHARRHLYRKMLDFWKSNL